MLLSELITHLTNAMGEAGNVVVDGVDFVEHTVEDGVHKVGVYAHGEPAKVEAVVEPAPAPEA